MTDEQKMGGERWLKEEDRGGMKARTGAEQGRAASDTACGAASTTLCQCKDCLMDLFSSGLKKRGRKRVSEGKGMDIWESGSRQGSERETGRK